VSCSVTPRGEVVHEDAKPRSRIRCSPRCRATRMPPEFRSDSGGMVSLPRATPT
jgi:hypothetical protein